VSGGSGPCLGDLVCADTTSCKTVCATDQDCASPTDYCAGGACLTRISAGACTTNDECTSDICGTTGTGNCCNAPCITAGVCGATDCKGSGACAYPPSGTGCGTSSFCTGTVFTSADSCDGAGTCVLGTPTDCSAIGDVCDQVLGCVQCVTNLDCLGVNDAGTSTCMNNLCQ
jgi:hypothetical protein